MKRKPQNRKEYNRRYKLLYTFGISVEQYDALLEAQEGKCAVCREPEIVVRRDRGGQRLVVDHCHSTGKIRGLLCTKCNSALGNMHDSTELLKKLLNYLEEADTGLRIGPSQERVEAMLQDFER